MKVRLTIILFFISLASFGQSIGDEQRIGLVLSGGGAKGMAHIGVLKTLDSLGIKVDYVAGTSMGSIVGAMYASGYTGNQLEELFSEIDFDELIGDEIPREAKTFYERDISEKYAISLPFDKFKINIPSALSRGQNVFNLFSRLLLHVSDIEDFSELPIPFFCIATNIETGEQVMLDSGSLPQAISASGALPSLFQPVVVNDKILIDGGVVNNYPVDELRAKGMDMIIGVDVQDSLFTRQELKSAPDILLQINNFRTIKDMKEKSVKTDIYIKPDIRGFNVVSFDDGKQIIRNGELAALKHITELKNLTNRNKRDDKIRPKIGVRDSITIKDIEIRNNNKYTRAYILGKLKFKANERICYNDLKRGVNNLVATNNFDSFIYDFEPNGEGYNFVATVHESENATFLKFGAHYDDLYKSAALINITQKRALFKNDVTSLDIILGDNVRYNFEYFIDKGYYWSVGLRSRYNTFHKNVSASLFLSEEDQEIFGVNKADIELSDQSNQFFLRTLFRKDFSLTTGIQHKRLKITSETFINDPDPESNETTFEKSDFISLFGNLKFDTYDNRFFPNKGFYFDGDIKWFLSSSDFNNNFDKFAIAKAKLGYAFSISENLSMLLVSEGGFKIGDQSNNSLSFALGGYGHNFINNFISFYGYDYISVIGDGFVKGVINLDYEIAKKHHLNFAANYANVDDDLFENGEWFTAPDYSGYAVGYGLETFFGPVEIKYTWSPDTDQAKWFFNVGYWF